MNTGFTQNIPYNKKEMKFFNEFAIRKIQFHEDRMIDSLDVILIASDPLYKPEHNPTEHQSELIDKYNSAFYDSTKAYYISQLERLGIYTYTKSIVFKFENVDKVFNGKITFDVNLFGDIRNVEIGEYDPNGRTDIYCVYTIHNNTIYLSKTLTELMIKW